MPDPQDNRGGSARTEETVTLFRWKDTGLAEWHSVDPDHPITREALAEDRGELLDVVPATLLAQERERASELETELNAADTHAGECVLRAESAEKQRDEAEAELQGVQGAFTAEVANHKETEAARDEALARASEAESKLAGYLAARTDRQQAQAERIKQILDAKDDWIARATQAEAALEECKEVLKAIYDGEFVNSHAYRLIARDALAALQSENDRG